MERPTLFWGSVCLFVCLHAWPFQSIYHTTVLSINKRIAKKWEFDESRIFAQIDAYVQRCRDLLEVCEWQIQFSQKVRSALSTLGRPPEYSEHPTRLPPSGLTDALSVR
jgi:hypothetical protein